VPRDDSVHQIQLSSPVGATGICAAIILVARYQFYFSGQISSIAVQPLKQWYM